MRRTIFVTTVLVLGIVTLTTVIKVATIERPRYAPILDPADAEAVRRYYAAVNVMLESGDDTELRDVLSRTMYDTEPAPYQFSGVDGFVRYLDHLRTTGQAKRIIAESVTFDENRIVASVSLQSISRHVGLGLVRGHGSTVWPSTEVFHVVDGRITERTFGWDRLALIEPAGAISISGSEIHTRQLDATSWTIESGQTLAFEADDLPAIIVLTGGDVAAILTSVLADPRPAEVMRLATNTIVDPLSNSSLRTLSEGTAVVIPTYAKLKLSNQGSTAATVIIVSARRSVMPTYPVDANFQVGHQAHREQSPLFISDRRDDFSVKIAYGYVTVMAGGRLQLSASAQAVLVWAEDESLVVSGGGAARCIQEEPEPAALQSSSPARFHALCKGDEGSKELVNIGNDSATAWIVAITAG